MTLREFYEIDWHRGNVAKLNNGKEYLVKGVKGHGKYILLYSYEYDAYFVADHYIVESRTSDYEEPEEVYLEMKRRKREEAEAIREAEKQAYLKAKAERKLRNIQEQERIHQEALARKAAKAEARKAEEKAKAEQKKAEKAKTEQKKAEKLQPAAKAEHIVAPEHIAAEHTATAETAPEQPKRKRQRIRITRPEKVKIK